jgi:hypothetical protein
MFGLSLPHLTIMLLLVTDPYSDFTCKQRRGRKHRGESGGRSTIFRVGTVSVIYFTVI